MPIYEYACLKEHITEKYFPADINVRAIVCPSCDTRQLAVRIISRPHVDIKNNPYFDETLGVTISSERQRQREMQRQGVDEVSKRDMSVSDIGIGSNRKKVM